MVPPAAGASWEGSPTGAAVASGSTLDLSLESGPAPQGHPWGRDQPAVASSQMKAKWQAPAATVKACHTSW